MNSRILAGTALLAAAVLSVPDIRSEVFVWTGEAGTTAWRDAGNWRPSDRFPGAEDVVRIEAGEVTVEEAEEVGILDLHGGTLGGGGTLTVLETLVWAGGAWLTGTGRTILAEEAVGWVESPQAVLGGPELGGSVLEIRGYLGFADGGFLTLTNVATVEIAPGGSVDLSGDPGGFRGGGRIVNRGLLQKTSEGAVSWHYYFGPRLRLINDGIVSVRKGSFSATHWVESDRGVFHAGQGASMGLAGRFRDTAFLGTGEIVLSRGWEFQGNILADHLTLWGATLTGACRLQGNFEIRNGATLDGADVTVDGRLDIVGGQLRLEMRKGSRLQVSPGGVLSVGGPLKWTFSGTNTMEVLNRGEIRTGSTGGPISVSYARPVGSTNAFARWINHGTLRHSEGELLFQRVGLATSGRMEVQGGSVFFEDRNAPVELRGDLSIAASASVGVGGVVTVPEGGARVGGGGWLEIRSHAALVADGTLTVGRLRCWGGWLEGAGGVVVESELDFQDSFPAPSVPRPRGTRLIVGPRAVANMGSATLRRLTIINHGSLSHRRDDDLLWARQALDFYDGTTIENHGDIHLGPGTQWVHRGGSPPAVVNHGRMLRTDGDGETVFVNLPVVNHGRIEVDRGWLSLRGPVHLESTGTLRLRLDADPDGYRGPRLIAGRPLVLAGRMELVGGAGWSTDPVRRRALVRAPELSGVFGSASAVTGGTGADLRLVYRSDGVDVVDRTGEIPAVTGVSMTWDAGLRLDVETPLGQAYRLESSPDLRNWTPWATNRVPALDGPDSHRFFRIAP